MTSGEWAAWITAAATVIYTLGTIGLWFYTIQSVGALKDQIKSQLTIAKSQALHATIDAHRELYMKILTDSTLLEIVMGQPKKNYKESMLASMLINQCSRIYHDYKKSIVDSNWADHFRNDAADLFSVPIVLARWPSVESMHEPSFRQFINENVLPVVPIQPGTNAAHGGVANSEHIDSYSI
jgi:hypothetical protein